MFQLHDAFWIPSIWKEKETHLFGCYAYPHKRWTWRPHSAAVLFLVWCKKCSSFGFSSRSWPGVWRTQPFLDHKYWGGASTFCCSTTCTQKWPSSRWVSTSHFPSHSFPPEATCFHKTAGMRHVMTFQSRTGRKYNDGLMKCPLAWWCGSQPL